MTLKLKKDSPIKVGSLMVQPTPGVQEGQNNRTLVDLLKKPERSTIQPVINELLSDQSTFTPSYNVTSNKIIPNFGKQSTVITNNKKTDLQTISTKKIKPYEELTGISQIRPEIVMLTNFSPLFEKEISNLQVSSQLYDLMTDTGKFVDVQLQVRQLKDYDLIKLYSDLGAQFSNLSANITKRKSELNSSLLSLKNLSQFLNELLKTNNTLKSQLDLRDVIHTKNFQSIVNEFTKNFSKFSSTNTALSKLSEFDKRYLLNISIIDTLVLLGYKQSNVNDEYSSSKLWLQLLYELKKSLEYHTLGFIDADSTFQKNDNNPSRITTTSDKRFGLTQNSLGRLYTLDELSYLDSTKLKLTITDTKYVWNNLYESIYFKNNETKIVNLVNLLSKEYKYSKGLVDQTVRQTLSDYYGYSVKQSQTQNNESVFEYIIGKFGNYITDFPSTQTNSLTNLAQQKPTQDTSILTFESKYIEGLQGIVTPGSEYFVDYIFDSINNNKFDTSRIDFLGNKFDVAYKNFSTIVEGFNLLSFDNIDNTSKEYSSTKNVLTNPLLIIDWILDRLVSNTTNQPLKSIATDNLACVFTFATKNETVKTALFLLVINKILTSNSVSSMLNIDSTQKNNLGLTNELIETIVSTIESNVKKISTQNQKSDLTIKVDAIRSSLKIGTSLMTLVDEVMRTVLTLFKYHNAFTANRTNHRGMLDTVIMMITFDIVVNLIANYCGQNIVAFSQSASTFSKGLGTFYITKVKSANDSSISSLVTKLEKEIAINHSMIYSILNTLKSLATSFKNYSFLLNNSTTTKNLANISNILNDNNLIKMLLNEQQIILFSSIVQDLIDNISQDKNSSLNVDMNADNIIDINDMIKIIDNSSITITIKNALYALFGNKEYASRLGYNKKILTIGIPLGFSEKLKQIVNVKNKNQSAFIDKQSDIIQIVVYKVDLQNSDIIYKPKRFLFELSRFPVRNDKFAMFIDTKASIEQIIQSLPTRDLANIEGQNFDPEYWSKGPVGCKFAFDNSTYSFLQKNEKETILKNHIISYLCESYIKILTGIDVGEKQFDLIPQERLLDTQMMRNVVECYIANVKNQFDLNENNLSKSGGVLFSTTATKNKLTQQFDNNAIGTLESNLTSLSSTAATNALHGIKTISASSRVTTNISNPETVVKHTLSPKAFDRVFSVIVDPDDFEIDYDLTVSTPHGKTALEQLISCGIVIPATDSYVARNLNIETNGLIKQTGRSYNNLNENSNLTNYKFKDKVKSSGDLSFEKYFVTIETFGEENV